MYILPGSLIHCRISGIRSHWKIQPTGLSCNNNLWFKCIKLFDAIIDLTSPGVQAGEPMQEVFVSYGRRNDLFTLNAKNLRTPQRG